MILRLTSSAGASCEPLWFARWTFVKLQLPALQKREHATNRRNSFDLGRVTKRDNAIIHDACKRNARPSQFVDLALRRTNCQMRCVAPKALEPSCGREFQGNTKSQNSISHLFLSDDVVHHVVSSRDTSHPTEFNMSRRETSWCYFSQHFRDNTCFVPRFLNKNLATSQTQLSEHIKT